MAKAKEFENILNECLDRLIKGETIESCLKLYPQYAAELEPLLTTALEAKQATLVKPRPEFRQRAANEFQAAIRNLPVKKAASGFRWQVRWVAPVAVIVALLAGGGGTVAAATNALPDSPLYGVKLTTESVQMVLTFSDQAKTELYARFVDYRVEEIVKMAEAGNYEQVEQATERMNVQLLAMAATESNLVGHGEKAAFGLMMQDESATGPSLSAHRATTPSTTPAPATSNMPFVVSSAPPTTENWSVKTTETTETSNTELSEIEQLRLLLTSKYEQNLKILQDQLEKAPEALKPALQKAIEVLEQGYLQAIANLG
jgi:hypothetical protein